MPGVQPPIAKRVACHRDHRVARLGRIAAAPDRGRQPIAEFVRAVVAAMDVDPADDLGGVALARADQEARLRGPARQRQKRLGVLQRSEAHTSELQSLMRISYAVFCLQTKIYLFFLLITTLQYFSFFFIFFFYLFSFFC